MRVKKCLKITEYTLHPGIRDLKTRVIMLFNNYTTISLLSLASIMTSKIFRFLNNKIIAHIQNKIQTGNFEIADNNANTLINRKAINILQMSRNTVYN